MMNNNRTFSLFTAVLIGLSTLQAQSVAVEASAVQGNASNHSILVAGTTLASMHNAIEVLELLPGVVINAEGELIVEGKLGTAVYIGTHKVTDASELYSLEARKIKSVEILTSPGADYGKEVQSVITFKLKKITDNGIIFSNDLHVSINNRASFNEELHLGYKHEKLNLGAHLSWSENKQLIHNRNYTYTYTDKNLTSANIEEVDEETNVLRKIIAQADLSYDFSNNHHFSLFYRTDNTPWKRNHNTGKNYYYAKESGVVNFDAPASVADIDTEPTLREGRQQINVEYHGKWGTWNIDIGHNDQWFNNKDHELMLKTDLLKEYNRDSYTMRNYLKASVPLWSGTLSFGIEQNIQSLDILHYDPGKKQEQIHSKNGINTWADYISISQKWGRFSAAAGLRHEHNSLSYEPFADDAFYVYLKQLKNDPAQFEVFKKDYSEWESSLPARMLEDGEIITRRHHFYPNAALTYEASEKSVLSLSFSRTYHIADLGLSRIYQNDGTKAEKKLLKTEHIYNTILSWKYGWLNLSASHNYFVDPLCITNDGNIVYNGKDYHFMDLTAILSPKVGCWQPSLMLKFNKQWFNMNLANGKTSLNRPRGIIHFNNAITLPSDWSIYANAEWYSKGDLRNEYYYNGDFMMNMSVQKELCNKHLSLALKIDNAFHSSWKDITTYRKASSHISNGVKSRKLTEVIISAKYTL